MRQREREAIEKKIRAEVTAEATKTIRHEFAKAAKDMIHAPLLDETGVHELVEIEFWLRGYQEGIGRGPGSGRVNALRIAINQIRQFLHDYQNLQRGLKA